MHSAKQHVSKEDSVALCCLPLMPESVAPPPPPQVRKGLEKLYRRVEKDVSDEVLAVVWGAMQEAFMEQTQHFQVSLTSALLSYRTALYHIVQLKEGP